MKIDRPTATRRISVRGTTEYGNTKSFRMTLELPLKFMCPGNSSLRHYVSCTVE